tara:strand:- start:35 stop:346 length:312 start_codon:yes stop_codon:yes gene_type:complete
MPKFEKGNTVARDAAAKVRKKKQEAKLVLSETDMLQAKIYNESLKQILQKLEDGELSSSDLIRVNSTVAEFASSKKRAGAPKKVNTAQKDVDDVLKALGYDDE